MMTGSQNRRTGLLIVVLTFIGFGRSPLEAQETNIAGVIKDTSAQPMAGVLVRVRSEELGLSFTVVSQKQGRYATPNLLPGRYIVQGFSVDHQSEPMGPLAVRGGQHGQMDLTLNVPLKLPPPHQRMNDADFAIFMPEGKGKGLVESRCTICHTLQRVVSARKTPQEWQKTVNEMRYKFHGKEMPLNHATSEVELIQLDTMADYLGKTFALGVPVDPRVLDQGPESGGLRHPNRNLLGGFFKRPTAYVAMEYSLLPNSMPQDIAVDSEGTAWVSEANTGMLGRFDPNSLTYTRISPSRAKNPKVQMNSIAVDSQDHLWFVDEGTNASLVEFKPKTGEFNSYSLPQYLYPIPPYSSPARLAALRFLQGNIWATGPAANWIVKLEPKTGKTTEYPVAHGSSPYGLAIGGDHRIWFAAEIGNFIGRLDPTTGAIIRYDVPTARSLLRGMVADAEGNLWVAATESGKLLKVDFQNGTLKEFDPPTHDSGPYSVDVDTKRNLIWFSELYADKIARFDPKTNIFVEFPAPSADLGVRRVEVDRRNPNRVWWSGGQSGKIGYIEVIE